MAWKIHWPQIVQLVMMGISLGISLVEDGKPKQGRESFLRMLLSCAITVVLLYYGDSILNDTRSGASAPDFSFVTKI